MKRWSRWFPFFLSAAIALSAVVARFLCGCRSDNVPDEARRDPSLILVTGYCNCGACCGWTRNKGGEGEPVYDYGRLKGKPKKIGITASGTKARHGTIAADPKVFPFGSHLFVPGYGAGTVEDIGGSIKGRHIDIWFPSHDAARRWGARWLKVERR